MRIFLFLFLFFVLNTTFSNENDIEKDVSEIYNKIIICVKQDHIKNGLEPLKSNRVFCYINIGTFVALNDHNGRYNVLINVLNNSTKTKIKTKKNYLLSIYTCYNLANKFIYDNNDLVKLKADIFSLSKKYSLSNKSENKIQKLAEKTTNKIVNYSNSDGFNKIKSLNAYFYLKEPQFWKPTPNDYRDAAEPNWGKLRMFFPKMISNNFFPIAYDTSNNSAYISELKKIYATSFLLDSEKVLIAKYWDDNPDQNSILGHENEYRRRINPSLHWILIANSFQKQNNLEYSKMIYTNTILTISLFDGLVYCWKKKYEFNTVRPVTVINQLLDLNWSPIILTPPHPEFPSGHSIISTISSEILTYMYGNNNHFTDSSLVYFGMPARTFYSFDAAAKEASMSRFYGGIHYEYTLEKSKLIAIEYARNIIKLLNNE